MTFAVLTGGFASALLGVVSQRLGLWNDRLMQTSGTEFRLRGRLESHVMALQCEVLLSGSNKKLLVARCIATRKKTEQGASLL